MSIRIQLISFCFVFNLIAQAYYLSTFSYRSISYTNAENKSYQVMEEDCFNGVDDDGDGRIDFMDDDCQCNSSSVEHLPNVGFENYTDCITYPFFDHWKRIALTFDYYNFDCINKLQEDFFDLYNLNISNSCVGVIIKDESFGTQLLSPLQGGKQYKIEFDYLIKDLNDVANTNNSPVKGKINVYGWYDAATLDARFTNKSTCFDQYSDAEILYSIDLKTIAQGQWNMLQGIFKPSKNIQGISFEIDCNSEIFTNSLLNSFNSFYDNISIKEPGWDYVSEIKRTGSPCEDSMTLSVKDSSDFVYQWYRDGSPINGADKASYIFKKINEPTDATYSIAIINKDSCQVLNYDVKPSQSFDTLRYKACEGNSIYCDPLKTNFNIGVHDSILVDNLSDCKVQYHIIVEKDNSCQIAENCFNGIDDDGDGRIDFMDDDCQCNSSDNDVEHLPNVGFENHVSCSDGIAFEKWKQISGTFDYFNRTDCNSPIDIWEKSYDIRIPSPCLGSAISNTIESFGTKLETTLEARESYQIKLDFSIITWNSTATNSSLKGKINVYGWHDFDALEARFNTETECFDQYNDTEILYSIDLGTITEKKWNAFTHYFTPSKDIQGISFEMDCNDKIQASTIFYAFYDNISIKEYQLDSDWDYTDEIKTTGSPCQDSMTLSVKDSSEFIFRWYRDSMPINDADKASYVFKKLNEPTNATYSVAIINKYGCNLTLNYDVQPLQSFDTLRYKACEGDLVYCAPLKTNFNIGVHDSTLVNNLSECQVQYHIIVEKDNSCQVTENCFNGIDDDGDGRIDFMDEDCQCNADSNLEHLPNVGFDNYTDCKTYPFFDYWKRIAFTYDYFSSDCPNDLLVLFNGLNINLPSSCLGHKTKTESFGTQLLSPLQAGKEYKIKLDYLIKDLTDMANANNTPVSEKVNVYGWYDAAALNARFTNKTTCFDQYNAADLLYSIDLSTIAQGEWNTLAAQFTPSKNIQGVSFELDCGNSLEDKFYSFYDSISIIGPGQDPYSNIETTGSPCQDSMTLSVKDSPDFIYQWYRDSMPINDADKASYVFKKLNEPTNATYSIAIINKDSCGQILNYDVKPSQSFDTLRHKTCEGVPVYCAPLKTNFNIGVHDSILVDNLSECETQYHIIVEKDNSCQASEDCFNGVDDDGDGRIDFMDEDCQCNASDNDVEHLPNVGFDNHISCEESAAFEKWKKIGGTFDYYSRSGCNSDLDILKTAYNIDILNPCIGAGILDDIESFGTKLDAPIEDGKQYRIKLDFLIKNWGDFTNANNTAIKGKINVYGWYDAATLQDRFNTGARCFDQYNDAEILYSIELSTIPQGQWNALTGYFTPSKNIQGVSFEMDCNYDKIQLKEYVNSFYDNISIKESNWDYNDTIKVNGYPCQDSMILSVKDSSDFIYQWYRDSVPINGADKPTYIFKKINEPSKATYSIVIINQDSCSQILNYVTTSESIKVNRSVSICEGDYIVIENDTIREEGVYSFFKEYEEACDSFYTYTISVNPILYGDTSKVTITDGDYHVFYQDTLIKPGYYQHTHQSLTSCDSIETVEIIVNPKCTLNTALKIDTANCFGEYHSIEVMTENTEYDVKLSIDGGNTFSQQLKVDSLPAGKYPLSIFVFDGCTIDLGQVELPEVEELRGKLAEEYLTARYDSIEISPFDLNFVPKTYFWDSNSGNHCTVCPSIVVAPSQDETYSVTITDDNNCKLTLSTIVRLKVNNNIHIPNIFSPNGDGKNDYFKVFTSQSAELKLNRINIYDRWGDLVYKADNLDENWLGWNGRYHNEYVISGVYVYVLEYELGENKLVKHGTVAVLK